jgi:hypothetical protein
MIEPNAFVSPEYPVLYSILDPRGGGDVAEWADSASAPASKPSLPAGTVGVSLAVLVGGIPSFLATVPVERSELEGTLASLGLGDVRITVIGISIDERDLPKNAGDPPPSWQLSEAALPSSSTVYPAAHLSLVCQDGRRVDMARIVARKSAGTPEEVASYIMQQITRGVQIPDLASAR